MHIILGLIGILGAAAFWWWRVKMIGEAANEITDAAGKAVGKYKRYKFRKKVEDSPLEAVDDPAAAAVVMMFAAAQEGGPVTADIEAAIRREVSSSMGIKDPTEIMVFSKWVASHATDANNVSLRYAKLWIANLSVAERRDFVDMVERIVAAAGAHPSQQANVLGKLRERLVLTN